MVLAVILLTAAAAPSLESDFPTARLSVRPGESTVSTAINLDVASTLSHEESARELLQRYAGAFGIQPNEELKLLSTWGDARWSGVRFERQRLGVPVLGAELIASFDGSGHLVIIHAGRQLPPARGAFVLPDSYALARGRQLIGVSPERAAARQFWVVSGEALRPAWVVIQHTADFREFSTWVDAQTGEVLQHQRIEWSVTGTVYDYSPARSSAAVCPQTPDAGYTNCASVVTRTLGGLATGATSLQGPRVVARNCQGTGIGTGCLPRATPTGGNFVETPNLTTSNTDRFGELMAYYHGDNHSAWFDSLSPAFQSRGGLGTVDVFTNVGNYEGGFFVSSGPFGRYGIQLGQGPLADWAYDADVLWHELGHGVVAKTSGFGFYSKDAQGIYGDSGALNEGTADCFSLAHKGSGQLGEFTGSQLMVDGQISTPYLRTIEDKRTCQIASVDATTQAFGGRVGEIHADGVIWGSFFWILRQRLAGVSTTGLCTGCNAAEAVLLRALDSIGSGASFNDGALGVQQVAASLLGASAGQLVGCLACDFDMKSCDDRTRIVFPNETHEALLTAGGTSGSYSGVTPATFQYALDVPANTTVTFNRFAIESGALTLYARFGQKVSWSGGGATSTTTITAQGGTLPSQTTAGRWYIQGAHDGAMNRRFGFRVALTPAGTMTRPPPPSFACTLGSGVPAGCNCVPQCAGKMCGSDGCGGSCGTCTTPQTCSATGKCGCTPQCTGKMCGADGCGGSCGTCTGTQQCGATGMCACVPSCSGKSCGDDGCGGNCGACPTGQSCTAAGACMVGADPCAGKNCGPDGTGDTCGSCNAITETCSAAGTCVASGSCGIKLCGPNGVGGSCGTCGVGEMCTASGTCTKEETMKGGCGCSAGGPAWLSLVALLGLRRRSR